MNSIPFDPEVVRSLANILREAGLTEMEIVQADLRIRLVRHETFAIDRGLVTLNESVPRFEASAPRPAAPPAEDALPAGAVTSPMVGVAFLSPDPASPPFIATGQVVTAGQTVMLIEAMKTFNQIKAPRAGTVTRILVANGQPVEYGQPLLVIE